MPSSAAKAGTATAGQLNRDRVMLRVSEMFRSIQGEGASAGAPCVFLRLALCNLRCSWCDTKYTWDWSAFRYDDEVSEQSLEQVAAELARLGLGETERLVITGGEPLIQAPAIEELLSQLPEAVYCEVETNGTFTPTPALAARINQWNVSPKLAHGGDPVQKRLVRPALQALLATGNAWLKLVIESDSDVEEADQIVQALQWPKERVLLMPQATTRDALRQRLPMVEELAEARGYGACSRLHIEQWGGRRGV